jgi:hypothetical protein
LAVVGSGHGRRLERTILGEKNGYFTALGGSHDAPLDISDYTNRKSRMTVKGASAAIQVAVRRVPAAIQRADRRMPAADIEEHEDEAQAASGRLGG